MISKGLNPRPWLCMSALAFSVLGIAAVTLVAGTRADGDDREKNGTFSPTGVRITPDAAPGAIFQALNPGLVSDATFTVGQAVSTAGSPDGKTLWSVASGCALQDVQCWQNASKTA